jgi:MYXO-CTERM domain-containing protein
MRRLAIALGLALVAGPAAAFDYHPPGDLISGSGQGRVDDKVYAPGMRFPFENAPAFANSQVYNPGGYLGPGGGQCDSFNYNYPWRDNYCETRQWDMPLCPAGTGHQGQDIRPATCENNKYWGVAAVDGTITSVGSYSVYLTGADGTRYDYLHMSNVKVGVGQSVTRGQQLGNISNAFGGTPTTIHLHFNLRQNVQGVGTVYVPPYMSLIQSYKQLVDGPAQGYLDEVDCTVVRGWSQDKDEPEAHVPVTLSFIHDGGAHDETVLADYYRGDLCENLGFCDHGFEEPAPLSLFDGQSYAVHAFGGDGKAQSELVDSPMTMACEPFALEGSRRHLDEATFESFGLSAFWDELPVEASEVDALAEGAGLAGMPEIVFDDDGAFYLVDEALGVLRPLVGRAARFWRLNLAAAVPDDGSLPVGADLPERPVVVWGSDGERYLVDVAQPTSGTGSGPSGAGVGGGSALLLPPADGGCACLVTGASSGAPSPGWLLFGLGAALWRRRQRPRTKP